jgi:hypothetical protein
LKPDCLRKILRGEGVCLLQSQVKTSKLKVIIAESGVFYVFA